MTASAQHGKHSLVTDIEGRDGLGLEHVMDAVLTVRLSGHRVLGKEDWVISLVDMELFVQGIVPDPLEMGPVEILH